MRAIQITPRPRVTASHFERPGSAGQGCKKSELDASRFGPRSTGAAPDHLDVATSLYNYTALLKKIGRTTEAVELEARANAVRAKRAKEIARWVT